MQQAVAKKWVVRTIIALNVFVLVLNVIFFTKNAAVRSMHVQGARYTYLSKRVFAEDPNDVLINFTELRQELRTYTKPAGDSVSMYFEYLPSGNSVGVNPSQIFFGASLLKLPVAMKAYKLIEDGKLDKSQQVTIEPSDIDRGFGDLWRRGAGATLSLDEVLRLSIAQSDNTADKILRRLVKSRPVSDVFDYLDIPTDLKSEYGAGVTAKGFSSVLRALYLSSYLSSADSNNLLTTMTTSPYNDRIVAGIPQNVKVAHKVGIYEQPGPATGEVHSDCGIIYIPKRPYMLCIMSTAAIQQSTEYMRTISKMVYDYVSSAEN
ncbi:MAG TPA: serine hydrolase [Candidatus Saccharimonadales bacterium]|nr:serine hydrolase [Candidatus Saccharimonadales bacterium]